MGWPWGEIRKAYRIFTETLLKWEHVRWDDNIKMDLRELGCGNGKRTDRQTGLSHNDVTSHILCKETHADVVLVGSRENEIHEHV
jgi:hypothetical protein